MQQASQISFGQVIAAARKKKGTIREVAALLLKENGEPISHQYLSDIENNNRVPSNHLIEQLADVLGVSRSYLYFNARRFPANLPIPVDEKQADKLYKVLERELGVPVAA